LAAVQEAYGWLMKMNAAANAIDHQPTQEEVKEADRIARAARDWYDLNVLYLHGDLPTASSFLGVTNILVPYLRQRESHLDFWTIHQEAMSFVRRRAEMLLRTDHRRDG
jgi:hypothetical protein